MSYAAELIKKAREARQYPSDKAVAVAMGIDPSTLNQWKHGKGSPMPQERVLELCDLADIKDEAERGYWLFGIQRDAVTITSVQRAIDTALDRLRPAAAVVGLLLVIVGIQPVGAKAWTVERSSLEQSELSQLQRSGIGKPDRGAMPIMSTALGWLRRQWTRLKATSGIPRGQPAWT